MKCPKCEGRTIVADVRVRPGSEAVYRRRICQKCGAEVRTWEYTEEAMARICAKMAAKAKRQLGKQIVKMIREETDAADRSGQNRLDNVSG